MNNQDSKPTKLTTTGASINWLDYKINKVAKGQFLPAGTFGAVDAPNGRFTLTVTNDIYPIGCKTPKIENQISVPGEKKPQ